MARRRWKEYAPCSRVDIFVILFILCVLCAIYVAASNTPSPVKLMFMLTESAAWSGVDWIGASNSKTDVIMRTGIVWTFTGWIIKPAIRFAFSRWWRRANQED